MAEIADVVTPWVASAPDSVSAPVVGEFYFPPVAWAFLITPQEQESPSLATGPLIGALVTEGSYLEPTIGQIWPR